LVSLVDIFVLRKNLIILTTLLFLSGCASNFNSLLDTSNQIVSIDKPSLKFKPKNFPEQINVLVISKTEKKNKNSLEGIIANYYFYKNNLGYSPKLQIFQLPYPKRPNQCLQEKIKGFSIVLILDINRKDFPRYCLEDILALKGLLITSNSSLQRKEKINLSLINIDRQEDLNSMLSYANKNTRNKNLVIDNLITKDKSYIQSIWEEFGRITAKTATISDIKSNEEILAELLLIKRSKDRARKMSRAISSPIEYLPRRRGDIDSIFLSVDLIEARTLKPAIDYNFAESIDVYLVPNWESEESFLDLEKDLEGVIVLDMPFKLNAKAPFLDETVSRNRSFAIGYDSYELALILSANKQNNLQFTGMTGTYSSSARGKLSRKSLKVKVQEGKLKGLKF